VLVTARPFESPMSPDDPDTVPTSSHSVVVPPCAGVSCSPPPDGSHETRDWIPLPDWAESNETKAPTGSDALNGLDGARADGYRGSRLPNRNSTDGGHPGVL
jgi:hypothetical protein